VPLLVANTAIAAFGVFLMNSKNLGDVRIGSVLVLVGATLAFPTAFGHRRGVAPAGTRRSLWLAVVTDQTDLASNG